MKKLITLFLLSASLFLSPFLWRGMKNEAFSQIILPNSITQIPMRDGKSLAADIYTPSGCTQCPTILIKTPYARVAYRYYGLPLQIGANINSSSYNIVIVDWRGFYGSLGAYIPVANRGEDGYDCVQWIASQPWSDGKVAMFGASALGGVQFQTARENPPNLVCIVPEVAAPMNQSYDAYFPGGVYRTEYVKQLDALNYSVSNKVLPYPVYSNYWSYIENDNDYADKILVPGLMIGGWYDHTVQYMLPWFNDIRSQSPANVRDKHRLLMGPWVHGGSDTASYVGSAAQGELTYPSAAGWADSQALLFLDYHMRNIANGWNNTPYVSYFQMGDDTWKTSAVWPPAGLTDYKLYFHADTSMDLTAPSSNSTSFLSFNYDPTDPSPTVGGPTLDTALEQGPYDQGPLVESRNDILKFTTATLPQDVVMQGSAKVHLSVSSDKKDTDFDIRLTDVYPDGRSMLVNDGAFRMRFRSGFTAQDTAVMIPQQIYTCDIDLPPTAITFKAGHRIRVDITSSNYPRFNRNANTGGVMYPYGSGTYYGDSLQNPVTAFNKIYVDDIINNSYITLPLTASPIIAVSESLNEDDNLLVYPNPTKGKFRVWSSEFRIQSLEAYNVVGERVFQLKNNNWQTSTEIDLPAFPKGIYFLKFKKQGQSQYDSGVKKIVVY